MRLPMFSKNTLPIPKLVLVATAAFGLILSGCSSVAYTSTRRAAHAIAPTWFGFVKISDHVYVNQAMPQPERVKVLKAVSAAKARVARFFGRRLSHPKILVCSTERCFVPNREGPTPKGLEYGISAVLVSPHGLNVTILSHELTHAELHDRVGLLRTLQSIPHWFDEGLAVLVSRDSRYSRAAWCRATDGGRRAPTLQDIDRVIYHEPWLLGYGTARARVGAWYARVGRTGLDRLIREVRNGTDFHSAFNAIARTNVWRLQLCPTSDASGPAASSQDVPAKAAAFRPTQMQLSLSSTK